MEIYLILQRLVSIPSVDNEAEVQLYLTSLLEKLGFSSNLDEVLPGRPNLEARRGEGGPLIVAHADTFPRGDHPDPFHLRDLDGKLIGRGSMDAKGQIAALIKALSISSKPCQILITVDEERGGKGSETAFPDVEGALVLEPTKMEIAIAQAGFIESEITLRGESAHGALPEKGKNAILKAFGLYQKMRNLSFMKASHPLFPPPWINLQSIHGGDQLPVVPSGCTMQTDLAILPGVDLSAAMQELETFLQRQGAQHHCLDSAAAIETDPLSKVAVKLATAFQEVTGMQPRYTGMRSWTDAANIAARGTPATIFGAGNLALAHSARESIETEELDTLARILAAFVDLW